MRNSDSKTRTLNTKALSAGFKKFFILIILGVFVTPFVFGTPARAMSFQEAAKKGDAKITELDELKTFLGKTGLKKLQELDLSNIKVKGDTLTGDVKFMKIDWTFIASTGGTIKNTFIGFGPKSIFQFKDMFPRAKGIDVLDAIKLDDLMLLVAGADIEIEGDDLSSNAKKTLGRFYENPKFSFAMKQGVAMFGSFDLGNADAFDEAIKFLGGKSTKIQLKGELSPNVLDSLLEGTRPQPSLNLTAAMPTFRPKIGGLVQLPADVQFTFNAELTKESTAVGFAGKTKFSIGKQDMDVTLSSTLKAEADKPPSMTIKIATFKGEPWEQAFGVDWLTIENYNMTFKANAAGKLSIGLDGTTSFGQKAVGLGGSIQVQAASLGIPLPESLRFEINDGPNKVGALALRDMAAIFNAMAKADGGKVEIPLHKVPDVAIAGVAKGEGPKIELNFEASGDAGIDLSGKLRVLGTDIATIDKAFVNAGEGIEIRARSGIIKAGPIKFPTADIEVVMRVDRDAGTIPTPKIIFKTTGLSLFGSKSDTTLAIYPLNTTISSNSDFGKLVKFNFRAFSGLEGIESFADFAKADYRLLASLQSDPTGFIKDHGMKAVNKVFDGLQPGVDDALADLEAAKKEVAGLTRQITTMRKTVEKERAPAIDSLKAAEKEVARLGSTISGLTRDVNKFNGRIESCNQTKRICTWSGWKRGSCAERWLGKCVWYHYSWVCKRRDTVANIPARIACTANNIGHRAERDFAKTKRAPVIAAKVIAEKTLETIRKGLEKLPIDLDPRVAALIIAKETANVALDVATYAVEGVGEFKKILEKGVKIAGGSNIFKLEESTIRGSLNEAFRGGVVVLDMNYRVRGNLYKDRFGFKLDDWEFNGKQMAVILLGVATQAVIEEGKKLKIIPHALLNKVNDVYLKYQADVDAVITEALKVNGDISTKEGDAKLRLSRKTSLDKSTRSVYQSIALKKKSNFRAFMKGVVDKKRAEQLAKLLADGKNKWKKMPGKALDIGAGPNGSVWVVGTNGKPYSWTGKGWKKMPGAITRIDMGARGDAWAINKANDIYSWNGRSWKKIQGKAWDIGVGANGTAWHIGGGDSIYRMVKNKWKKVPGRAVRIDVDPNGNAWIVNKSNVIYSYDGKKKKWIKRPGKATDIAVSSNGSVMVVGLDRAPWAWDGKTWHKLPGANLKNLTLDKDGNPMGTTTKNEIWAWGAAAKPPAAKMEKSLTQKKIEARVKKQQAQFKKAQQRMKKKFGFIK